MQNAELSGVAIALISAGSAVVGAAVVAVTNVITTWFTERSQERRHLTELAFHAAVEQYKNDQRLMVEMAARQPREHFRQYPLDDYLIGMAKVVHVLGRNPSDEELGRALDSRLRTLGVARERYQTMDAASMDEAMRRVQRGEAP